MNHSKTISEILVHTAKAKAAEIAEQLRALTDSTVMAGPFQGMKLPTASSWGDGDVCPKLLGTYEQELHVSIETLISRQPVCVVNIGCGEGYYAVGLARRLGIMVEAIDTDMKALDATVEAIRINDVNHVSVGQNIDRDPVKPQSLFVIDCEGSEEFELNRTRHRSTCDFLIECHDFINPGVTDRLKERLAPTHSVEVIREGPRDPGSILLLQSLNTMERYVAVCEFRPTLMHWIVALANDRGE